MIRLCATLLLSLALVAVSNAIDCRVCTPGIPVANQCANPNDWRIESDCAACGTLNFQFRDDGNDYRRGNGQWVQLNDYSCITPTMLAFVSPVVIDKIGLRSAVQQQQRQNGGFNPPNSRQQQQSPRNQAMNVFRPQVVTGRNGAYGQLPPPPSPGGGYGGGATSFYTQSNNNNNNFGTYNEQPAPYTPSNNNQQFGNNLYGQQQQQQQYQPQQQQQQQRQPQRYQNASRTTFVTENQPPFNRYETDSNDFENSRLRDGPGLYDRNGQNNNNNDFFPQGQPYGPAGNGGGSASDPDSDGQQQFNGGPGPSQQQQQQQQQSFSNKASPYNSPQQQQFGGNSYGNQQQQQFRQPQQNFGPAQQQQFRGGLQSNNNPQQQQFSEFGNNQNNNNNFNGGGNGDLVCTDNAELIKQFQVDSVNGLEHQLYDQEGQQQLAYVADEYRAGLFQTFSFPQLFQNVQMCLCFSPRCTDQFQPGQPLPVSQYNSGERRFQQQNGNSAGENAYLLREPQYQQNELGNSNNNGPQNSQSNLPGRRLARQPTATRTANSGPTASKTPPARFADEEVGKAPSAASRSNNTSVSTNGTNPSGGL